MCPHRKCVDSPLSFPSGRGRTATREDIGGSKVKAKVCKKKEKFASHCPKTCNKCEEWFKCKDSTKGFFIREGVKKKCKWLNKISDNEKEEECMKKSVESTCRDTCGGYCVLSSAPPTAKSTSTVNPTTSMPTTAIPSQYPTNKLDIVQTGDSVEAKATEDVFGRIVSISENGKTLTLAI